MWGLLGNILEMFVYAAVYMIISIVSLKIVGASFFTDFDRRMAEEASLGPSLICAAIFVGLALVLSSVIR